MCQMGDAKQFSHWKPGNTVEPIYNDIGLKRHLAYNVSYSVVSVCSPLLTIILYSCFGITLFYNDIKYSVPLVALLPSFTELDTMVQNLVAPDLFTPGLDG